MYAGTVLQMISFKIYIASDVSNLFQHRPLNSNFVFGNFTYGVGGNFNNCQ